MKSGILHWLLVITDHDLAAENIPKIYTELRRQICLLNGLIGKVLTWRMRMCFPFFPFTDSHNSPSERALGRTKHTAASIGTPDINTAAYFKEKGTTLLHKVASEHSTMEGKDTWWTRKREEKHAAVGVYLHTAAYNFFHRPNAYRSIHTRGITSGQPHI